MPHRLFAIALAVLLPVTLAAQDQRDAAILRSTETIDPATARALVEAGVEFGEYAGPNSYYVSIPSDEAERINEVLGRSVEGATVEPLPVEAKTRTLSDGRGAVLTEGDPDEIVRVRIIPAVGAEADAIAAELDGYSVVDSSEADGWIVALPRGEIGALAEIGIVAALYPATEAPLLE